MSAFRPKVVVDLMRIKDKDEAAFMTAFRYLVPADQTAIAALVFRLATLEKQNRDMAKDILARLEKTKNG